MDKYRCELCQKIEKFVHMCGDRHFVCELCVNQLTTSAAAASDVEAQLPPCKCGSPLSDRQRNPLDALIEVVPAKCPHSQCSASIPSLDLLPAHVRECPWRPYECIGTKLKIWACDWTGQQADLFAHIASGHSDIGAIVNVTASDRIPFDDAQTMGTLSVIAAFERHFVFFYYTNACTRTVSFIVFVLGNRTTADKYVVDFQLSTESHERVHYVTACRSDLDDLHAIIEREDCIALSHRSIGKYLDADGCVRFRVSIRDKTATPDAVQVKMASSATEHPKEEPKAPKPAAAKPAAKKTSLIANLTKKSASLPSGNNSSSSGGGLTPLHSRVPALGSEMPKIAIAAPPPPLAAAHPAATPISVQKQQHVVPFNQPSVEQQQHHLTNPATHHSPGAGGSGSGGCIGSGGPFGGSGGAPHQSMYRPQPYKAVDTKFYTIKYPNTSIQKPVYKK